MIWTAEADKLLVDQWHAGASLTEVMKALKEAGHDIQSRNEVAGRKWRLRQKGVAIMRGPVALKPKQINPPQRAVPLTDKPLRVVYQPAPVRAVRHNKGVGYMSNTDEGCKAILDRRDRHGLHMVCGRLRCEVGGVRSPYCADHCIRYMSNQANRRVPSGQVSEAG